MLDGYLTMPVSFVDLTYPPLSNAVSHLDVLERNVPFVYNTVSMLLGRKVTVMHIYYTINVRT